MSIGEAFEYLKDHPEEFAYDSSYVNEYDQADPIISIKLMDITREAENKDKDFVRVELLLRSDLQIDDINEYIKDNLVDFSRRALEIRSKRQDLTAINMYSFPGQVLQVKKQMK